MLVGRSDAEVERNIVEERRAGERRAARPGVRGDTESTLPARKAHATLAAAAKVYTLCATTQATDAFTHVLLQLADESAAQASP